MINFLKEYQIDPELCKQLVNSFELVDEKYKAEGCVGNSIKGNYVDVNQKESLDLSFTEEIQNNYPEFWELGQQYLQEIQKRFIRYKIAFPELENRKIGMLHPFQMQKYLSGGGFKTWHFENSSENTRSRVLAFMTYLNDVENGGTEFKYQEYTAESKIGNTLIWPADFTHTHRGVIANETKYIITGWIDIIG